MSSCLAIVSSNSVSFLLQSTALSLGDRRNNRMLVNNATDPTEMQGDEDLLLLLRIVFSSDNSRSLLQEP